MVFRPTTKIDRFNPLFSLGHSMLKQKKTARGVARPIGRRGKMAVKSMPKNRIGVNNGLIVSNQKVPHPKKGSVQYRRSCYGVSDASDKLWLGGSSIGTELTHFKTIAHTILVHYLNQMGDYRSTNVSGDSNVWSRFRMSYATDAPSGGGLASFRDGGYYQNTSYEAMAQSLGIEMASLAGEGYFPRSIKFETPDLLGNKLEDTNLGRHTITVSIKGRFRFQNVTQADGDQGNNINAIDANPVSGKIYTFRNQAPIWTPSYVQSAGTTQQTAIKALNTVATPFEMYGDDQKGAGAFIEPAPPLNPSSIWRNVSSTGNVAFPPGGFKTYKTSYLRSETIFKYCQVISQSDVVAGVADHSATFPPAGDSFMMCLRPTIKTTNELIKVAFDTEYILKGSLRRRRPSPLQVVNDVE